MLLGSFAAFFYLHRNAYIGRALLLEALSVSMTTGTCYNTMRLYKTRIAS